MDIKLDRIVTLFPSPEDDEDKSRETESFKGTEESEESQRSELLYGVDDSPSYILSVVLAFQHYITVLSSMVVFPVVVASVLCIGHDWLAMSEIMSTILFVTGIATLLQCLVGCRLPIVQGSAICFLVPAIALFAQDECHPVTAASHVTAARQLTTSTIDNSSNVTTPTNDIVDVVVSTTDDTQAVWRTRMREIQGGLLVASLVQMVIGATGVASVLLRYIGPLTMAPVITLVAVPLFNVAAGYCARNWWIAFLTIILVVVFSQFLRRLQVNVCVRSEGRWEERGFPFFGVFAIALAITGGLVAGVLLTVSDSVPPDLTHWSYWARVDTKIDGLHSAPVFRVPYPFQWGLPTFSTPGILSMVLAVLASMVVSVDDYCACARLAGVPLPPEHAVNRGILVEGFCSLIASMVGTGTGLSSFRDNVGVLGITKVASRRVVVISAVLMIIASLIGKWMAVLIMIPEPVIGGLLIVLCGTVAAAGISQLQHVDLNSTRNLFIIGLSIMFGMALPLWLREHPTAVDSGILVMDQTLNMLGMTSMFVGGFMALILDNMIPGSEAERGVKPSSSAVDINDENTSAADDGVIRGSNLSVDVRKSSTYDLPCFMTLVRRHTCNQFVPFCPTFAGFTWVQQRLCGSQDEPSRASAAAANDTVNVGDFEETIELQ